MDPDKFRKTRIQINQLCEEIRILSDKNDAEASLKKLNQAGLLLEELAPQVEGEIQKRSVKNLGMKMNAASSMIDKIKTNKKSGRSENAAGLIKWDEARLSELSPDYLSKALVNIGPKKDCKIRFSTTGKGVRPSYQIDFENGESSAFSGSTHKPLKRLVPKGSQKISQPFPVSVIKSILSKK